MKTIAITLSLAGMALLALALPAPGCAVFDRSGIPCDAWPGACGWDAAPIDAVPDAPPVPDASPVLDAPTPDALPPDAA